ncbi:MAG: phosphoadenylyl-sulfate reductase [Alphaproteobacteria bacterium]|nr:phosphoadenylyl-sulfate reductase [Alphaproteobacteria bacterium]
MTQTTQVPQSRKALSSQALALDLAPLNARYEAMTAQEILRHAIHEQFVDRITIVSSFGAESVILLHMISQIEPSLPVIMLNTGKLFGETLRYRDRLQDKLKLTDVRTNFPHPDDLLADDPKGSLWQRDTDACCDLRKVRPQARAVAPFDALITGRKRFQTGTRATMDIIERDTDGRFKLNPLANWQLDELKAYIEQHDLPRHPLVKDGYLSIGCMPCTNKVAEGEDYRSGRWADSDKDECGIHLNIDGDGI